MSIFGWLTEDFNFSGELIYDILLLNQIHFVDFKPFFLLKNQFILDNLSEANNCFVIKTESGVEKYGVGPNILFESKTRRIFDLEQDLITDNDDINKH